MKCQNCESYHGGMFIDQDRWFIINLCGKCAIKLDYPLNNFKNSAKCKCCGKRFIPKGKWQKDCTSCWISTKPKNEKEPVSVKFKFAEPQTKLNKVILNAI